MNLPQWEILGTTKAKVIHEDGSVDVNVYNNKILNSFYNWIVSKQNVYQLNPTLKLGTGTSETDLGMSGLESLITLTSGSWPAIPVTAGTTVGDFIENDTVVSIKTTFVFIFKKGQVVDTLSEYGMSMAAAGGSLVDTRVKVTDSQGNPATITVLGTDQLVIEYMLELRAPKVVPPFVVPVVTNGVSVDHTFQFVWGPWRNFAAYLNMVGGYINGGSSATSMLTANVSSFAADFAPQTAYGTTAGLASVVQQNATELFIDYTFGSTKGNQASGINYLSANAYSGEWWRYNITPPIAKAEGQELKFRLSMAKRGS